MADRHPYVSSPGGLVQVVAQLRKSFPATVNAATLKKLGFAPNNESYVLNVLRFLALIDDEGKKTAEATKVFHLPDDAFATAFADLVRDAYSDLFDLQGDGAWDLDNAALTTFFRTNDDTTEIVGTRQAATFRLLAAFSGHGDVPEPRSSSGKPAKKAAKPNEKKTGAATGEPASKGVVTPPAPASGSDKAVGLTVRIEVNLPADGSQSTYDRIFKSIRENLLNG